MFWKSPVSVHDAFVTGAMARAQAPAMAVLQRQNGKTAAGPKPVHLAVTRGDRALLMDMPAGREPVAPAASIIPSPELPIFPNRPLRCRRNGLFEFPHSPTAGTDTGSEPAADARLSRPCPPKDEVNRTAKLAPEQRPDQQTFKLDTANVAENPAAVGKLPN